MKHESSLSGKGISLHWSEMNFIGSFEITNSPYFLLLTRIDLSSTRSNDDKTKISLNESLKNASGSWFTNKGQGRRYDHIFSSESLTVNNAFYDHEPREKNLSDHSPVIAEFKIR